MTPQVGERVRVRMGGRTGVRVVDGVVVGRVPGLAQAAPRAAPGVKYREPDGTFRVVEYTAGHDTGDRPAGPVVGRAAARNVEPGDEVWAGGGWRRVVRVGRGWWSGAVRVGTEVGVTRHRADAKLNVRWGFPAA